MFINASYVDRQGVSTNAVRLLLQRATFHSSCKKAILMVRLLKPLDANNGIFLPFVKTAAGHDSVCRMTCFRVVYLSYQMYLRVHCDVICTTVLFSSKKSPNSSISFMLLNHE